jgi:threonine dehydrogenase-like Zn-dependent dehydrogenase
MKAQVFLHQGLMKFQEVPDPVITDYEILISVKACGICGSDLAYFSGTRPLKTSTGRGPLVLGHEISGIVEAVGTIAKIKTNIECGDRVVINPVNSCFACRMCSAGYTNLCENIRIQGASIDGGLAEYIRVFYTNVYRIPARVSFEQASLIEPLCCALHAVDHVQINFDEPVIIIGPGTIGLMLVQIVRALGATNIIFIGTRDFPLEKGIMLGASQLYNVSQPSSKYYSVNVQASLQECIRLYKSSTVFVASNSVNAMELALSITHEYGKLVFVAAANTMNNLNISIMREMTMDFSWLAPQVWPRAFNAIKNGMINLEAFISHRFSLDEAQVGFEMMLSNINDKTKGVVINDG